MPPALFFLLMIVLAMHALFWFHMKYKVVLSSSVKKENGSLMGNSVQSVNYFGEYGYIFLILILPNNEHGMFFHLFVSSLISLSSGL